jgi:hypothetical protein
VNKQFCTAMATDNRLDERTAVIVENPNVMKEIPEPPSPVANNAPPPKPAGSFTRLSINKMHCKISLISIWSIIRLP